MLLNLSDISSDPLHQQISNQVRSMILAGDLKPDSPLPSIRGLAKENHVSVITVQRSYDDLVRENLIVSKRGKGFFVVAIDDPKKGEMARNRLEEALLPPLRQALNEGLEPQPILGLVKNILDDMKGGRS